MSSIAVRATSAADISAGAGAAGMAALFFDTSEHETTEHEAIDTTREDQP